MLNKYEGALRTWYTPQMQELLMRSSRLMAEVSEAWSPEPGEMIRYRQQPGQPGPRWLPPQGDKRCDYCGTWAPGTQYKCEQGCGAPLPPARGRWVVPRAALDIEMTQQQWQLDALGWFSL